MLRFKSQTMNGTVTIIIGNTQACANEHKLHNPTMKKLYNPHPAIYLRDDLGNFTVIRNQLEIGNLF